MKTRKILSLALALVMVLALSTPAMADGYEPEATIEIGYPDHDSVKIDVSSPADQSGEGWNWNAATKTLRLSNITCNFLLFSQTGDVILELVGENKILQGENFSANFWVQDYSRVGTSVTVTGSGTLLADHLDMGGSYDNVSLTVQSGTLSFRQEKTYAFRDSDAAAIALEHGTKMTVEGGSVFASGYRFGVYNNGGQMIVKGGEMTLEGGEAAMVCAKQSETYEKPQKDDLSDPDIDNTRLLIFMKVVGGASSADALPLEIKRATLCASEPNGRGTWGIYAVAGLAANELTLVDTGNPLDFKADLKQAGLAKYAKLTFDPSVQMPIDAFDPVDTVIVLDFWDVVPGSWYEAGVTYVTDIGLFQGVSERAFSPNTNMTRAMLMTVLARLDGQETSGGATWYAKAMDWAKAQGISDGSAPDGNVTREQLVTMLYRYAKPEKAEGGLNQFADAGSVSDWAKEAMEWAVANGIVTGKSGARLDPQGTATRAEVATIIQRFAEKTER